MTEKEFHNQRSMFAVIGGRLVYGPRGMSHSDWLMGQRGMSEYQFSLIIRGYRDNTGVYFYSGDFATNEMVESCARKLSSLFRSNLPIYCGCVKGRPGERWQPITQIR